MESIEVPFLALDEEYAKIKEELWVVWDKFLKEGKYILGKPVEELEEKMKEEIGVKYAIGVASGTDALYLLLKAYEIKEGDEVITSPYTFIATAEVIAHLNAKIIFVDINPYTYNLDVDKLDSVITERTKCILPVHLFGQCTPIQPILKLKGKKEDLVIIEDAAQAYGATYMNKHPGAIEGSDGAAYSFFPTKNLSTFGDGGLVVTNNEEVKEKIYKLRTHGALPQNKYLHYELGYNSRLDAIHALTLLVKLKYLKEWQAKRLSHALFYNSALKELPIKLPVVEKYNKHTYNQYVIRVEKRDELASFLLKKKGIQTMVYYPMPLHLQPCFKYLNYKEKDFPHAEKLSKEALALPIHPHLTEPQLHYIVDSIKEFFHNPKSSF
jgi:dTDP-4-amino-4,6-dideoxygalactose transaminase